MPADNIKWNYANVMKLLNLLRVHPVLWDQDQSQRTKYKKELALKLIAAQMDTTVDKIKRKIHTMRSQYAKECRLMKIKSNYRPKWKLFDDFRLVFKHDHGAIKSKVMIEIDDDDMENSKHEYSVDKEMETFSPEEHNSTNFNDTDSISSFGELEENCENNYKAKDDFARNPHKRHNTNTASKSTEFLESSIHRKRCKNDSPADNTSSESQNCQDEFSIFGENVANELRLLKGNTSVQLALKCKILRALLEANEALHRLGWIK